MMDLPNWIRKKAAMASLGVLVWKIVKDSFICTLRLVIYNLVTFLGLRLLQVRLLG